MKTGGDVTGIQKFPWRSAESQRLSPESTDIHLLRSRTSYLVSAAELCAVSSRVFEWQARLAQHLRYSIAALKMR